MGKKPGNPEPILIVCEGVTELCYLTELSQFMGIGELVDIRFADDQNPASNVERLAKERFWAKASGLPYAKEVWLVFDRDRHVGYRKAVKNAELLGMKLAVTRPCIEYWFLLHFAKAEIELEKDGRVVYGTERHEEVDRDGVVTETVVTRYEPVTTPEACLKALKKLAPWYSKTKISFLAYFGTRTKRAYERARAFGRDPNRHGSGIPDIIDRFCELADMTPEELFEAIKQATKDSRFFASPDITDRFMPPEVGHIGAMLEILAKGEKAITEEEWLFVGNTAESFAAWAKRIVGIREGTAMPKKLFAQMESDAGMHGETDLEAAAKTLSGIIASHDGGFGEMTDACLVTLFGVLCRIREAARKHQP